MMAGMRQVIPEGYSVRWSAWVHVAGVLVVAAGWYFGCNATMAVGAAIVVLG